MSRKFRIGLAAGLTVLAMSSAAFADNLVFVGEANTAGITGGRQDAGITNGPASYASAGRYGSASASMDLDVIGGRVRAQATASQFGSPSAVGRLDYSFHFEALDGSLADVSLQLNVAATGFADSSGRGGSSYVEFYFGDFFYDHVGSSTLYNPGPQTYSYSHDPVTVGSRSIINIRMIAQAQANGATGVCTPDNCGASAEAWIDPTFTLLGPNASNYRIVGVPGPTVAPPTGGAVPEPATWALMIAGFGLAGASLRRRRRDRPCPTSLAPSAG